MISIDDFINEMLFFFPGIKSEVSSRMKEGYEGIDTIVIEDIIMPEVIKLLKENSNTTMLKSIFDYFEDVCVNSDDYLNNVFSITSLEILGNEKDVLEIAKSYMGPVTTKMQREADLAIGRKA